MAHSFEECQSLCTAEDGCYFFTWSGNHNHCHLTWERSAVLVSSLPNNPSTVTGPRTCVGDQSILVHPQGMACAYSCLDRDKFPVTLYPNLSLTMGYQQTDLS